MTDSILLAVTHGATRAVAAALIAAISLYRVLLSPMLPPACRYVPSCSAYAHEAIRSHGPWRGSLLAAARLLRCHPFGGSGVDTVPSRRRT